MSASFTIKLSTFASIQRTEKGYPFMSENIAHSHIIIASPNKIILHVSSDKLCGIPGEVMDLDRSLLATLKCQKLGKPTWNVFNTAGGISI
jgi:hypothetical protein